MRIHLTRLTIILKAVVNQQGAVLKLESSIGLQKHRQLRRDQEGGLSYSILVKPRMYVSWSILLITAHRIRFINEKHSSLHHFALPSQRRQSSRTLLPNLMSSQHTLICLDFQVKSQLL